MKDLFNSILFDVDSYKVSMWKQYPKGTEYVSSYVESRGFAGPDVNFHFTGETVFIGLKHILESLSETITKEMVELANKYWTMHGEPFPYEQWMYIVNEHDGKLPLKITALPEGSKVGTNVGLVQVVNTDPKCYWLTTWVETKILRVWYPVTVATNSYEIKKLLKGYAEKTADVVDIDFQLHDFGSRGASSSETSSIGGMSHMVNFRGTDTFNGLIHIVEHYTDDIVGFSIPAMEHSTVTSWTKSGEVDAYENMIDTFGGGTFAIVSDSYDIYNSIENIFGDELKAKIENLEGRIVVRPDSGEPVEIVQYCVETLYEKLGGTVNSKGYKVLNDKVRVIQGDGVDYYVIDRILNRLERLGFSSENVAFGMGGALLQAPNRDDFKFAMKCSAIKIAGSNEWVDVFKDPITDTGKRSKAGVQATYYDVNTGFQTMREDLLPFSERNVFDTVFLNGNVKDVTWEDVMRNYENT